MEPPTSEEPSRRGARRRCEAFRGQEKVMTREELEDERRRARLEKRIQKEAERQKERLARLIEKKVKETPWVRASQKEEPASKPTTMGELLGRIEKERSRPPKEEDPAEWMESEIEEMEDEDDPEAPDEEGGGYRTQRASSTERKEAAKKFKR